ncbi:MAG: DUF86 domain-containing protein [Deltaproteobacteria bacterium]|nr:DUF86 domain-containing protein [Deltaproteobacteria bacterium]
MEHLEKLMGFLNDTINYFLKKSEGVSRDKYFSDRDIRNILDKTTNDIILCTIDIAEEILKKSGRTIPETYKDTILSCHEFVGDVVLRVAPIVKYRNEIIHEYLKVNWQNIVGIKNKLPDIREFIEKAKMTSK